MAKRVAGRQAGGSGESAAAPTAPPEASVCFSTVDDEEGHVRSRQPTPVPPVNVHASAAAMEEAVRESTPTAHSTGPAATPLTWPFLCPLCCAGELVEPVELHAPLTTASTPASGLRHCLACRTCAEHLFAAVRAVTKESSGVPHAGNADASCAAADEHLACPLCAAPLASQIALSPPAPHVVLTSPLEAELVRNPYTGAQQPSISCGSATAPAVLSPACRCAVCEESAATGVCLQCDFGLCDACRRATHAKGGFKQHEVVTLEHAWRRIHPKCPAHAGRSLDLFCETCARCVCVTCCFGGDHREHEVFPLAEVAARTATALSERAAALDTLGRAAEAAHVHLTSLAPTYDATVRSVREDIQRCFADLRALLQQREEGLLTQLNTAASDVAERATQVTTAVSAVGAILRDTSARLREMPSRVSAATLLRVAPVAVQQQEWVSHTSELVVDAATAAADGWACRMRSDGANGCGMAAFVLLNAETPNAEGLRQYRRVLVDLGRLDVVTDLHMPPSGRLSTSTQSSADDGTSNERGAVTMAPEWDTHADSAGHVPTGATALGNARGSGNPAADSAEDEMVLVRHSHVNSAAPRSPTRCATSIFGVASSVSSQAASGASPRPAESELPSSSLDGVSRTDSLGGASHTRELHVGLNIVDTVSSSMGAPSGAGYWAARTVASRWSAAHDEAGGLVVGRSLTSARLARETLPFRVSLPPRRAGSEDALAGGDYDEALQPRRAPKLRHGSSMRESRIDCSTVSPLPHYASATRVAYPTAEVDLRKLGASTGAGFALPSVANGRLTRAESQRRTTGLHLEL